MESRYQQETEVHLRGVPRETEGDTIIRVNTSEVSARFYSRSLILHGDEVKRVECIAIYRGD